MANYLPYFDFFIRVRRRRRNRRRRRLRRNRNNYILRCYVWPRQARINAILHREEALLRREEKVDSRCRRLQEIREAIARKKQARNFIIQEKLRVSECDRSPSTTR